MSRSGSSDWARFSGLRRRSRGPRARTSCSTDHRVSAPAVTAPPSTGWFGHPRGLSTLFFTEMWERFSYYGMRGFLILYMTKALGFSDQHAGSVFGNYVGSVWLAAIFGRGIADPLL